MNGPAIATAKPPFKASWILVAVLALLVLVPVAHAIHIVIGYSGRELVLGLIGVTLMVGILVGLAFVLRREIRSRIQTYRAGLVYDAWLTALNGYELHHVHTSAPDSGLCTRFIVDNDTNQPIHIELSRVKVYIRYAPSGPAEATVQHIRQSLQADAMTPWLALKPYSS